MRLIKQSFEIIDQTDFSETGIQKHIERCARVSYKSEDKITDKSYLKFVEMLMNNHHDRPLEFGTVHLKMTYQKFKEVTNILLKHNIYNDYWIQATAVVNKNDAVTMYITTNYRYYLEICKHIIWVHNYFIEDKSEYFPKRHTVHMILSRGVMDEFRTHVGLSHLAESTRYCNYSKDKFDNEITFVCPNWCHLPLRDYGTMDSPNSINLEGYSRQEIELLNHYIDCEYRYFNLLKYGCRPQEAREVLPLGVKSELISCGFKDAWENFFYRRCASDAHPMAREIAIPLKEELNKKY